MQLVQTSYSLDDVVVLLKDISGQVEVLGTEEREKRIQTGTHYSEMIPLEYKPSDYYMNVYHAALKTLSEQTAHATAIISEKVFEEKGENLVLVSLARAGTPIGILMKRYIKARYNVDVAHYSISIIRGKGFDKNAIDYIVSKHGAKDIQFVDGWIGKGAICRVLEDACNELVDLDATKYGELSPTLAVISDPAWLTDCCGTHDDFLIPSACLNSTVSGLFSRTYHKEGIIGPNDYHGAVYYGNLTQEDKSIQFIDTVSSFFPEIINQDRWLSGLDMSIASMQGKTGLDEVIEIAKAFHVSDINKIKPGVGETTRVLLRRIPDLILVRDKATTDAHILTLCAEKGIPIVEYPLQMYRVCGIIKDLAADA